MFHAKEQLLRIRTDDDGEILEKMEELCEVMSDEFHLVFANEAIELPGMDRNPKMVEIVSVEEDFVKLLTEVNGTRSPEPDRMGNGRGEAGECEKNKKNV